MTPDRFSTEVQTFLDNVAAEIQRKNADYAGDSPNPFAAFDEAASVLGLEREQVWAVFYMKHVQAIIRYVKSGGTLDSESVEDRLKDLAAYPAILTAMVKEKQERQLAESMKKKQFMQAPTPKPDPFKLVTDDQTRHVYGNRDYGDRT
jgi:hypothetical protein